MVLLGDLLLGIIITAAQVTAADARIFAWMTTRSELNAAAAFYNGLLWSVGIGLAIGTIAALTWFFIHRSTTKRKTGKPAA